jgi:hypothetical protein
MNMQSPSEALKTSNLDVMVFAISQSAQNTAAVHRRAVWQSF